MYESFFGLKESPFSIAPDPRYLYMSVRHKEALAHLLYGLEREGGFVLLTGEVGTGKTTICRCFIQSVPENTELAFILYPKLTARELLASVCDEFGITYPVLSSTKTLVDLIHHHLLEAHAAGKHTALIIDEAQNLSTDVLEQLRLLTNLETDQKKLLQIILLGQPELKSLLQRPELRQLSQRITARYHLEALDFDELGAYIAYRMNRAGCPRSVFTKAAVRQVHKGSRGIPRLANLICDRALLGAYSEHMGEVSAGMVRTAVREVGSEVSTPKEKWWQHWITKGLLSGAMAATLTISIAYWASPSRNMSFEQAVEEPISEDSSENALSQQDQPRAEVVDETDQLAERYHLAQKKSPVDELQSGQEGRTSEDAKSFGDSGVSFTNPLERNSDRMQSYAMPAVGGAVEHGDVKAMLASYGSAENDVALAFTALFDLWGMTADPGMNSEGKYCQWAELQGLRCLHREGNWRSLMQLNRPVVLKLMDVDGQRFFLTLLHVTEEQMATVKIHNQTIVMPLSDLDRFWEGSYSLLWRVPPYDSLVIEPGALQDKEAWLEQQLDLLDSVLLMAGKDNPEVMASARNSVKRPLEDRIREFQQMVGILPDGIAGTITLIMLNSWTNPEVPLLRSAKNS
ncbi:type II secretion protein ATPase [Hahella sp. CCB-MM4]|uniref:ExeA family protein n=1 Tax=Hahella sp. (strain CCB-MM4) TaxID=1926491 RepID=UPI000B9AA59A|nr:AAA family ATPase [Hahella sp. CCB-MM4]OZG73497.1 type II secretion protein ATPase [Hahella sp. CCB-MM4]